MSDIVCVDDYEAPFCDKSNLFDTEECDDFSWIEADSTRADASYEDDSSLKPHELVWPLPVVYTTAGSKAFVYALPSCFRVLCRTKKLVYTDFKSARRYHLITKKFQSFSAAKAFADEYVHARFANKKQRRRPVPSAAELSEDHEANVGKYAEITAYIDWIEYWFSKRSYPGDYITDNVYWWNKGSIRACFESSSRVPSWAL